MKNQENFPLLSVIALDIICAPVTEVTVERLFSHLKLILTKFRSSMKPDLLDDILFLRMNDILQEAEKKINKWMKQRANRLRCVNHFSEILDEIK